MWNENKRVIGKFEDSEDAKRTKICVNAWANIPDPEAFMAAHDTLVEECENLKEDYDPDSDGEYHATDGVLAALAAMEEAT